MTTDISHNGDPALYDAAMPTPTPLYPAQPPTPATRPAWIRSPTDVVQSAYVFAVTRRLGLVIYA